MSVVHVSASTKGVRAPGGLRALALACIALFFPVWIGAQPADSGRQEATRGGVTVRLIPRTPDQMAAFYEARGFPPRAIEAIRGACFVTVSIRNETGEILLLDLSRWRFMSGEIELARQTRADWKSRWEALRLPVSQGATFRWTLLPEHRDLWPEEPVGGNVTLAPQDRPFAVDARFSLGRDGDRGERQVVVPEVRCATESS